MSISRLLRASVRSTYGLMLDSHSSLLPACLLAKAGACSHPTRTDLLSVFGRPIHSSHHLHAIDVKVPSMGDSITEGSIASILRQTGDHVEEDEPILQIETDKVTIDVRAPARGILRALTVKEQDTVAVGAVVAVLDEQEGAQPAAAAPAAAAAPLKKTVDLEELTAAAGEVSDSTMRGHKARIKFPPRRTAEGFVISAMPAVDQQKYIARSASVPASASQGVTVTAASMLHASSGYVAEYISRRTLDEKEMEAIMLGGAEP